MVVRDVVAEGLQRRLSDPRIERFTSITRVEVSDDLSIAHVHVSVMADTPGRRARCVEALQAAAGRMRGWLGQALSTRTVPEIRFHLDEALQRGVATVQLLDELRREREGDEADNEDLESNSDAADDATEDDGAAADDEDRTGRKVDR